MSKIAERDELFAQEMQSQDFIFDERVASVFDDMVSRSVPLYDETRSTALGLARHFVQPKTNVFDLGCSTATLLLAFAQVVDDPTVKLIGIDNAPAMIEQARMKLGDAGLRSRVDLRVANIEDDLRLGNASVVFMNYTLQFIRPLQREAVLRRVYEGLNPNGCLILVEKVLGNDSLFNRLYIELYYAYKHSVGYSDAEIKQKREALENVLVPYRIDENIELLSRCGFDSTDIFFKWYNFAAFVAVKSP